MVFREDRGGGGEEKLGVEWISYNKSIYAALDSPKLEVIVDSSGGGGGKKFTRSGGRNVLVRGGSRRNNI